MPEYKLRTGSLHERFMKSRSMVQLIGGGFANGKTAAVCVKTLRIAKDYEAANILLARSTYPKLNDTLRKEFLKWCPKKWIKSFPMSANASNTCTLDNSTMINFRYVQQGGKSSGEATTSNLLSATFDLAVVDQIEDPEITKKDFDDILGRMRGNAQYVGFDRTMPRTGPGWVLLTCNPTRNWVFTNLVRPLHIYQQLGVIQDELLCVRESGTRKPVLDEHGAPKLLLELFEGSTYENKDNLRADFIQTLESAYTGQMRDRFLLGQWASYEGLVYPHFSEVTHAYTRETLLNYMEQCFARSYKVKFIEGFDYGMAVPSCYLLAFVDEHGNVIIIDGFYEKEKTITQLKQMIWEIRSRYGVNPDQAIRADPQIFRRSATGGQVVGKAISTMFLEQEPGLRGIFMMRGNNNITNGITKVSSYITMKAAHRNPITGDFPGSHLYVALELKWLTDEFGGYYWKMTPEGGRKDEPVDKNDHGMDALKYMLTDEPDIAVYDGKLNDPDPEYTKWHELEEQANNVNAHRYG